MESVDFEIRPTSQQGVASFSQASVSHSVDWLMVPVAVSTRVGAEQSAWHTEGPQRTAVMTDPPHLGDNSITRSPRREQFRPLLHA